MEKRFEERKENVRQFLLEYLTVKQLSEAPGYDEGEDMSTDPDIELSKPAPFDPALKAGQIRLLGKGTQRITYVALLKRWEADSFVVMPFSAFKFPATDGELAVNADGGMFQHVLQAWGTLTLQDDTLRNSWVAGELPQTDIDDAWALWTYTLGGKEPDDALLSRTGLPIYKSHDPRLEYQQYELANMAMVEPL